MTTTRVCKDCLAEWVAEPKDVPVRRARPAPHPGPRCATHHRAALKSRRRTAHARRVQVVYSISGDTYEQILAAQNGTCAICQRARGGRRRLAVDHDHSCCSGKTSCGRCVRGLLCAPCNDMLAHVRDSSAAFTRAAAYLQQPPAHAITRATHAHTDPEGETMTYAQPDPLPVGGDRTTHRPVGEADQ